MIPLSLLRRIERWLDQHLPFYCPACRRWRSPQKSKYTYTTSGFAVRLCDDCYRENYTPWERQ